MKLKLIIYCSGTALQRKEIQQEPQHTQKTGRLCGTFFLPLKWTRCCQMLLWRACLFAVAFSEADERWGFLEASEFLWSKQHKATLTSETQLTSCCRFKSKKWLLCLLFFFRLRKCVRTSQQIGRIEQKEGGSVLRLSTGLEMDLGSNPACTSSLFAWGWASHLTLVSLIFFIGALGIIMGWCLQSRASQPRATLPTHPWG